MNFLNIGILDSKKIISVIKNKYGVDYSNYSLISFKQRIFNVIKQHNLETVNNLIQRIELDNNFKELFFRDFSIPVTEMFRDPAAWREFAKLSTQIINKPNYKIWIPFCSTGEEVYTLAVVLKELGLIDRVKVIVSNRSSLNIQKIKKGEFITKQFEINNANYKRYKNNENKNFDKYYTVYNKEVIMKTELLKNFEFVIHKSFDNEISKKMDLILFRNKLIYYNLTLQEKTLITLRNSLLVSGYLFIGIKETIKNSSVKDDFIVINKEESIYKKTN